MEPKPTKHSGFKLRGQKIEWPHTWKGVTAVFVLCLTIISIVYVVLVADKYQNIEQLGKIVRAGNYDVSGRSSGSGVQTLYHFWTPSINTKYDVARLLNISNYMNLSQEELKKAIDRPYYWVSANNQEVDNWFKVLKIHHVVGFSYWEVTGSATEGVKRGLLWDVTISDENPISRKTLISLYADCWQRNSNIYIEEFSVYSAHETIK